MEIQGELAELAELPLTAPWGRSYAPPRGAPPPHSRETEPRHQPLQATGWVSAPWPERKASPTRQQARQVDARALERGRQARLKLQREREAQRQQSQETRLLKNYSVAVGAAAASHAIAEIRRERRVESASSSCGACCSGGPASGGSCRGASPSRGRGGHSPLRATPASSELPAAEEQVVWLASVLHAKMHQLFSVVNNGVPTKVSWFRLFKHMDDDESGLISYAELADMARSELYLSTHQLPEKTLRAVWLALDKDGSGRLTAGEFGAFMRLGERPTERVKKPGRASSARAAAPVAAASASAASAADQRWNERSALDRALQRWRAAAARRRRRDAVARRAHAVALRSAEAEQRRLLGAARLVQRAVRRHARVRRLRRAGCARRLQRAARAFLGRRAAQQARLYGSRRPPSPRAGAGGAGGGGGGGSLHGSQYWVGGGGCAYSSAAASSSIDGASRASYDALRSRNGDLPAWNRRYVRLCPAFVCATAAATSGPSFLPPGISAQQACPLPLTRSHIPPTHHRRKPALCSSRTG